jgi:hypothetical protein
VRKEEKRAERKNRKERIKYRASHRRADLSQTIGFSHYLKEILALQ